MCESVLGLLCIKDAQLHQRTRGMALRRASLSVSGMKIQGWRSRTSAHKLTPTYDAAALRHSAMIIACAGAFYAIELGPPLDRQKFELRQRHHRLSRFSVSACRVAQVLGCVERGTAHRVAKAPETVAFSVPFPTPLPFPKTCSQPWVGFEIPEHLRAFRQKP